MKKKTKENNIIDFSEKFMEKRVRQERKSYSNKIVGECYECLGEGIVLVDDEIMECISCEGVGTIYYGKENINWNLTIGVYREYDGVDYCNFSKCFVGFKRITILEI